MDLVFKTELERIKLSENLMDEINYRNLNSHIEKFEYIFELTSGKGREQYMQRAVLEFPKISRQDIDVLDRYV